MDPTVFKIFKILGIVSASHMEIAEMVIRIIIFLALLALGGYFFVLFHRRGYFSSARGVLEKGNRDGKKIIAPRIMTRTKYHTANDQIGKRLLLAVSHDRIEKLSEWEAEGEDGKKGGEI